MDALVNRIAARCLAALVQVLAEQPHLLHIGLLVVIALAALEHRLVQLDDRLVPLARLASLVREQRPAGRVSSAAAPTRAGTRQILVPVRDGATC